MRRQRLRLGIACETLSYAIELGYRADDQTSAFVLDPEIKREWIWAGGPFHPRSLLVQRTGAVVERCGEGGPSHPWPWRCRPTRVSSPLSPIRSKRRKCSSCATPSSAGASTTASAAIARPRPAAVASPPARLRWPATAETWRRRCRRTQVWVVAHAEALITALEATPGCRLLRLERELGATVLPGQTVLERAAWRWPG